MLKNRRDALEQELKVGDKIIHFGLFKTRIRPINGIISRFTDNSLFYFFEEHHLEDPKHYPEKRVGNFLSIIKYDWS